MKLKKIKYLILLSCLAVTASCFAGCGLSDKLEQWACEEHDYGSEPVEILKEATCTEKGEALWECEECGYEKKRPIDKLEHTEEVIAGQAATCTENGYTEKKYCTECNVVLVDSEVIPATGHDYVLIEGKLPTCTASGATQSKYCSACEEVFEVAERIPALGHTIVVDNAVAATCGADGKTEGSHCATCNEVFVAQTVIPATGEHDFKATVELAPTCGTPGYTGGETCTVCGAAGADRTEIPATGEHTVVIDDAVASTCTSTGLTTGRHCSVCEEVFTAQEVIPMLEHTSVTDEAVAATCGTDGKTEGSHCSVCNTVLVAQELIPATGEHDFEATLSVAPTCTTAGYTGGETCTVCGAAGAGRTERPALGHTVVIDEAVDATCGESGLTEGSHCSVCEEVLVAQRATAATGDHRYNELYVCRDCGDDKFFTRSLTYEIDSRGYVRITGIADARETTIVIPEELNGREVCYVGGFTGNVMITKVVIRARHAVELEQEAFAGCTRLETFLVSGNLEVLHAGALAGCGSETANGMTLTFVNDTTPATFSDISVFSGARFAVIYIPAAGRDAFMASGWSELGSALFQPYAG